MIFIPLFPLMPAYKRPPLSKAKDVTWLVVLIVSIRNLVDGLMIFIP